METALIVVGILSIFLLGFYIGIETQKNACHHKWKQLGETIVIKQSDGKIGSKTTRYVCSECGEIKTFKDDIYA